MFVQLMNKISGGPYSPAVWVDSTRLEQLNGKPYTTLWLDGKPYAIFLEEITDEGVGSFLRQITTEYTDEVLSAAYRGDQEEIEAVLAKCQDPNGKGAWPRSFDLLVELFHFDLVADEFPSCSRQSPQLGGDITPLMLATCRNHPSAMRTLLQAGADANMATGGGRRALHACGSVEAATILVDWGAQVNAKDASGQTPLTLAVKDGCCHVALFLLSKHSPCDKPRAAFAALETAVERWPCVRLEHLKFLQQVLHFATAGKRRDQKKLQELLNKAVHKVLNWNLGPPRLCRHLFFLHKWTVPDPWPETRRWKAARSTAKYLSEVTEGWKLVLQLLRAGAELDRSAFCQWPVWHAGDEFTLRLSMAPSSEQQRLRQSWPAKLPAVARWSKWDCSRRGQDRAHQRPPRKRGQRQR
mmetsp:Transcript_22072/g.41595  ORF Transcript_22072/g.41595 Transcript_22072/m.41595 type:complete len:412 (+) Transcript_22072:59-1294(+)